jgi:hypothetical protein
LPAGILGIFAIVCLFLGANNSDDHENIWIGQENSWFSGNPFQAKGTESTYLQSDSNSQQFHNNSNPNTSPIYSDNPDNIFHNKAE